MSFIKSPNKLPRLFVKITNNLRSGLFRFFYYAIEIPWICYNQYIDKINLKETKPQYPIVAPVDLLGIKFLIYLKNRGSIEEAILLKGEYEEELLRIADTLVSAETTIIDIGANIGFLSLYWAKKFNNCQVFSYEPTAYAFECLKKSKELNRLDNLKVFKLAAGDDNCQGEVYSPTEKTYNKGLGSINFNADIEGDQTYMKEKIDIVSLDEHIGMEKNVSLIKIDVQGTEVNVLKGALKLIEKDKPLIIIEVHDDYYERPLEKRQSIKALFAIDSYDFYRIKRGFAKRPYLFLEKIDIGTPEQVNNDILMVPKST